MTQSDSCEREWRVMEQARPMRAKSWWYPHGYSGTDETDARADLAYMIKHYGKYGRAFRLESREVGQWAPAEETADV